MIVHGLTKLTVVDYPGKVACIVFTGGCNFRCPYCHNGGLVLHPEEYPQVPEDEIFDFLKKRMNILDGVVISGGEPTLQKDLPEFARKVKELGYLVKLDTNGTNPEMLKSMVEEGIVDYVAMDVKNSLERYGETIGRPGFDLSGVEASMDYLMEGHVEYEFRTTMTREHHNEKSFADIASRISGCSQYYLQNYVASENTITDTCHSVDMQTIESYISLLKKHIGKVQLRDNA